MLEIVMIMYFPILIWIIWKSLIKDIIYLSDAGI